MRTRIHIILFLLIACFFVACTPGKTPFTELSSVKQQEIYDYFMIAHHESIRDSLPSPDDEEDMQDWEYISFSDSSRDFFEHQLQEHFPDILFPDYETFIAPVFAP